MKLELKWVETSELEDKPSMIEELEAVDGILVPGGFGKRGAEGKLRVIEYARTRKKPFLGICFGMQLAVVEFSRNVLGLKDANSTEVDPSTPHPVIYLMPEQEEVTEKGGTMRLGAMPIHIKKGTMAQMLYGNDIIYQRHRHRYEVNPKYWEALQREGMIISGTSPDGKRVEIIELREHPYFIATQFHPEFKSRPGNPDPAFLGLIRASTEMSKVKDVANIGRIAV